MIDTPDPEVRCALYVAERLARQDAQRMEWLTAQCQRPDPDEAEPDECPAGHREWSFKARGNGSMRRYCKACNRERMERLRAEEKAWIAKAKTAREAA